MQMELFDSGEPRGCWNCRDWSGDRPVYKPGTHYKGYCNSPSRQGSGQCSAIMTEPNMRFDVCQWWKAAAGAAEERQAIAQQTETAMQVG